MPIKKGGHANCPPFLVRAPAIREFTLQISGTVLASMQNSHELRFM